jgi:hypothetical protein
VPGLFNRAGLLPGGDGAGFVPDPRPETEQ